MGSIYIDSKWAAGFPRWERARVNALMNPGSAAAKLYRQRVSAALEACAGSSTSDHAQFEFMEKYRSPSGAKVEYRVCSLFCAAMQIQLDYRVSDREEISKVLHAAVSSGYFTTFQHRQKLAVRRRREFAQTRTVKCRACWRTIAVDGTINERTESNKVLEELWTKEQKFVKPQGALLGVVRPKVETVERTVQAELFAIDSNGSVTPFEDICIVRLSEVQHDLLLNYSTRELRREYGEVHGIEMNLI